MLGKFISILTENKTVTVHTCTYTQEIQKQCKFLCTRVNASRLVKLAHLFSKHMLHLFTNPFNQHSIADTSAPQIAKLEAITFVILSVGDTRYVVNILLHTN